MFFIKKKLADAHTKRELCRQAEIESSNANCLINRLRKLGRDHAFQLLASENREVSVDYLQRFPQLQNHPGLIIMRKKKGSRLYFL